MVLDQLTELLERASFFEEWKHWIDVDSDQMRFRFFVSGWSAPPQTMKKLSRRSREVLRQWRWSDNPHSYLVELGIRAIQGRIVLVIRPSFMKDERFGYRKKDVGASIDPVVASCLARIAGPAIGGLVTDPTCGSGTLLVERALLDGKAKLLGIDTSSTAIKAAKANIGAAGLTHRAKLTKGDSADIDAWQETSIVLANLPFGNRSRPKPTELERLYAGLVENAARKLTHNGRIVLYSSRKRALESAIHTQDANLGVVASYVTESDGTRVYVSVLTRL